MWVLELVYGLLELVFFRICSILKHTFAKLENILLEFKDLMVPKAEVLAVKDMLLGVDLSFVSPHHRRTYFRHEQGTIISSFAVREHGSNI